jgi:hypothetical protein
MLFRCVDVWNVLLSHVSLIADPSDGLQTLDDPKTKLKLYACLFGGLRLSCYDNGLLNGMVYEEHAFLLNACFFSGFPHCDIKISR